MRLGIFGGTFNPIHFGHLRTAEEVRYKQNLDKIIIIPSGNPPLKIHDLTDASHRHAMAVLAAESNRYFVVSDIEVRQKEKSYTVHTIRKLYEEYPGDELFLILGLDAFLDVPNWWQPDRLVSMVDFIIVPRPGTDPKDIMESPYIEDRDELRVMCNELKEKSNNASRITDHASRPLKLKGGRNAALLRVTPLGISSTDIRALIKEGKSTRYLLPEAVEKYISVHNLYA